MNLSLLSFDNSLSVSLNKQTRCNFRYIIGYVSLDVLLIIMAFIINNLSVWSSQGTHLIVIKQSYHIRSYLISYHCLIFLNSRRPPTFPQGCPCSILGRISLNHRVRDGYGCFPYPHRHRNCEHLTSSSAARLVWTSFIHLSSPNDDSTTNQPLLLLP